MTYAFTFDASACSGCKACQIACKDKNNLPVGVLWRRVYEVTGGIWQQHGDAWFNNVFAYNLSIACNHCVHPKCAGVCPTDAYVQREDGIVYIDETKCMGCGYCNWACPYGVPQYNPELGQMTKCNFCMDNLEVGLPPACVAACPMRVLGFAEVSSDQLPVKSFQALWETPATDHPFPLPDYSRTQPHLAIKPHAGMLNTLEKVVSNREEIKPVRTKSDLPLVAFTTLAQMAVGAFIFTQLDFRLLWALVEYDATLLVLIPYLIIGACLGLGGFFSFAHLGAKKNAWRAVLHLRKSWLSREILMVGLFGMGWLTSTLLILSHIWFPYVNWIAALFGLGLVYSMAQVYRLRSVPVWNTWHTNFGFLMTTLLTGQLMIAVILAYEADFTGIHLPPIEFRMMMLLILLLLAAQLGLQLSARKNVRLAANRLRLGLIAMGLALSLILFIFPNQLAVWTTLSIFLVTLAEETLGRWLFYEARDGSRKS